MLKKSRSSHTTLGRQTAPVSMESLESRTLMSSATWGAWSNFIYQPAAIASFPTLTGRGETVAVLDTGISNVPSLRGKIIGGYNFINNNTNYTDTGGPHNLIQRAVIEEFLPSVPSLLIIDN